MFLFYSIQFNSIPFCSRWMAYTCKQTGHQVNQWTNILSLTDKFCESMKTIMRKDVQSVFSPRCYSSIVRKSVEMSIYMFRLSPASPLSSETFEHFLHLYAYFYQQNNHKHKPPYFTGIQCEYRPYANISTKNKMSPFLVLACAHTCVGRVFTWHKFLSYIYTNKFSLTSFPWQGKIGDVFVVYTSKFSLSR